MLGGKEKVIILHKLCVLLTKITILQYTLKLHLLQLHRVYCIVYLPIAASVALVKISSKASLFFRVNVSQIFSRPFYKEYLYRQHYTTQGHTTHKKQSKAYDSHDTAIATQ